MEADMVCQTIVGELEVTAGEQKFKHGIGPQSLVYVNPADDPRKSN